MTDTQSDEPLLLTMTLTHTLRRKLIKTALDEGVTPEQLVQELVAEGLTLRAWEILERKSAMRGPSVQSAPPVSHGNRRGAGQHGTAWMEDKAAFLEYVRNQEKRHR